MKEIGGYFELELGKNKELYDTGIRLNSARNCLRYLIRNRGIKKIQIPAYTCPVIWESLENEGCEVLYYNINDDMLPETSLNESEYVLYNNYFGVCSEQVNYMKKRYPKLIIDNAQAFFSNIEKTCSFNSTRKFFGVSDGGYLFSDEKYLSRMKKDYSYDRAKHLLKRIECGATNGYQDYQDNEARLDKEDVKEMSELTRSILSSIDYDRYKKIREKNFKYLHGNLGHINRFKIKDSAIPAMIYPFLPDEKYKGSEIKARLIQDKIYVATYWTGQKDNLYGKVLEEQLVALPIDQRYNTEDMDYIISKINTYIN